MTVPPQVVVSGGLDDLRARGMRFLQEAARLGELTVLLWPDDTLQRLTGQPPKFPLAERQYLLEAVRYVTRVIPATTSLDINQLPELNGIQPRFWVDDENVNNAARRAHCARHNLEYRVLPAVLRAFALEAFGVQVSEEALEDMKQHLVGAAGLKTQFTSHLPMYQQLATRTIWRHMGYLGCSEQRESNWKQ